MTHQTGITPNKELLTFFGACKSGSTRAFKVSIVGEELQLDAKFSTKSTWEADWDSTVPAMVKDKQPAYVIYRLDSKNSMGYEWILISWSPDDSPIRQKMLYASTKATLKKQFGSAQMVEEVFATAREEVTFRGYQNFLKLKKAPAPLSMAEEQLENIKLAEASVDVSVNSKHNTLGSVVFPMADEAREAISSLSTGRINYVQLSIDMAEETVNLASTASVVVDSLSAQVPTDTARYHLYTFSHQYEADHFHSLVFIYSMPGYSCSIKERMLYSSCKASVVDLIENQLQLNIAKKIEIDDPSELTEEFLLDEIHPKKMLHRPKFDKPKGPTSRGLKRLTRPGQ